jgi:hypothetical protein
MLVDVLLELVQPDGVFILFLKCKCFELLFLLPQPRFQITMKLINHTIDLVLQYLKIPLIGPNPRLEVLPITLGTNQMIPEMLGQLREYTLHLIILIRDDLGQLPHLLIDVVRQLGRPLRVLRFQLFDHRHHLFVGA